MPNGAKTNICIECEKACGGCSWSAADPITGKLLFEPVPGWTATPVLLNLGRHFDGRKSYAQTYHITACPEFVPAERKM